MDPALFGGVFFWTLLEWREPLINEGRKRKFTTMKTMGKMEKAGESRRGS
jgi:hypothetical protein